MPPSLLETISGHDSLDSTSYPTEVPSYSAELKNSSEAKVLGLPKEFFGPGMDDEVRASIEQVIEYYRSIGYQTKEVSLPTTDLSIPVYSDRDRGGILQPRPLRWNPLHLTQ